MTDAARTCKKDPDARLDYGFDWDAAAPIGPWLADGETILTSTWDVPAGLTLDAESNDDTQTIVWITGGTAGNSYTLTNRITTSAGRTDDRSIIIIVEDR